MEGGGSDGGCYADVCADAAGWMSCSGCEMLGWTHRFRGLEAEIAFLMGEDLPPRETPYTREEVVAAIASCHPAIEVLESGLIDPTQAAKMSMIADLQMHGGFVYGDAYAGLAEYRLLEGACDAGGGWRRCGWSGRGRILRAI